MDPTRVRSATCRTAATWTACICIRTAVLKDGVAYLQAGAGIVADSDPEREYGGDRQKVAALVRAVDLAHAEFAREG